MELAGAAEHQLAPALVDDVGEGGELAALALIALSCTALGALIASVTPLRELQAGIVVMALVRCGWLVEQVKDIKEQLAGEL